MKINSIYFVVKIMDGVDLHLVTKKGTASIQYIADVG